MHGEVRVSNPAKSEPHCEDVVQPLTAPYVVHTFRRGSGSGPRTQLCAASRRELATDRWNKVSIERAGDSFITSHSKRTGTPSGRGGSLSVRLKLWNEIRRRQMVRNTAQAA